MDKEEIKFEDAMKELEAIVGQLEKGELNLDESIEKFEQGVELSKKCNKILDEAEKKITILLKDEDGEYKEEDFTVSSN